jgi:hypothetical protein
MKSPAYYRTRSIVRWIFWSVVAVLAVIGLSRVADWIDTSDENLCPVSLERDFTWNSTNGEIVNVYECQAPTNVRLLEDGRWEWAE